jgi:N-dimethylarginine dimethylaminohydrolase
MPESQAKMRAVPIEKIEVSLDEAQNHFACNLLSSGETVVMGAGTLKFQSAIEAHGLKVLPVKLTELAKGGGYVRCTTLTLDNA